ncbi:hypothetical protein [Motiliproteus sediminis]|uniref:hypothetical protein n=1 Tax=Motiliproteus sediminis TaxID=1468178 RepID=UPI001AEF8562|nr:hypothetical protein [Motiliproteus sediminis]
MATSAQYQRKIRTKVKQWNNEIAEFEAKAERHQASADSFYYEQIKELRYLIAHAKHGLLEAQ